MKVCRMWEEHEANIILRAVEVATGAIQYIGFEELWSKNYQYGNDKLGSSKEDVLSVLYPIMER